jgi:hypothetical protein
MGKRYRQAQNARQRANGIELEPGLYAGVKNWARFLKRATGLKPVKIKNPEKYLNASSKRFLILKERVPKVMFETTAEGFNMWFEVGGSVNKVIRT